MLCELLDDLGCEFPPFISLLSVSPSAPPLPPCFSFSSTSPSSLSLSPSRLLFHHLLIALLPSSPTFSSKLSSTFYLYQNCPPSSPPSPTPRSPHTPVSFSPPSDNYCHHQRHIWGWSHLRVQSSHVDCIQHTTSIVIYIIIIIHSILINCHQSLVLLFVIRDCTIINVSLSAWFMYTRYPCDGCICKVHPVVQYPQDLHL